MKEQSLIDSIEFDECISQIGLKIKITKNKDSGTILIHTSKADLEYNSKKFEENAKEYVVSQVESHTKYKREVDLRFSNIKKQLQTLLKEEKSLELLLGVLNEPYDQYFLNFQKFVFAPIYWMQFKTFEEQLQENFKYAKKSLDGSIKFKELITFGEKFIETRLIENKNSCLNENLAEWLKIQKELSSTYSLINYTKTNLLKFHQRELETYYSKK